MPDNAKILSYSMVSSALVDPTFYTLLPEFLTLQPKLKSLRVDIKPGGCTGCQKKRIESNLFKDFMYIVQAMDVGALTRLKSYYKLDKLMVNAVNPATGAFEFKVI